MHSHQLFEVMQNAIVICKIIFQCFYSEIEKKIVVSKDTAKKFIDKAIEHAKYEDFNEFVCCITSIDKFEQVFQVAEGIKLSATMQNAIFQNLELKSQIVVLDKKNIIIPRMPKEK